MYEATVRNAEQSRTVKIVAPSLREALEKLTPTLSEGEQVESIAKVDGGDILL